MARTWHTIGPRLDATREPALARSSRLPRPTWRQRGKGQVGHPAGRTTLPLALALLDLAWDVAGGRSRPNQLPLPEQTMCAINPSTPAGGSLGATPVVWTSFCVAGYAW